MRSIFFINFFTVFCLLIFYRASSQNVDQNSQEKNYEDYNEYTSIKVSSFLPIAVGKNFAGEAVSFKYTYNFDFNYYFPSNIMIGVKYQFIRSAPENVCLIGDYDRTNINAHGINLGYR